MYSTTRGKMLGLLYLAPAVLFVATFTAYPLIQMVWMSFHNWSIIEPAKWVGVANFVKAWNDRQFWVSLGFTLKYTLYITPILMILGYLIALLVATNTPLAEIHARRWYSFRWSSGSASRACSGTGCSATISAWSTAG